MTARRRHLSQAIGAALVALLVLACGNTNPLGGPVTPGAVRSVIVGSADFPESQIVAEIYAWVLDVNGFDVKRQFGIGSRETYIPALKSRSIDLVPDYLGSLLLYLDPDATATTAGAVELALRRKLPGDLSILTPSPASNTGTVTVTAATAQRWDLHTIADLVPHAAQLRFAAPPEFRTRPQGLAGLEARYGLDIRADNFVAISDGGGPATVDALVEGTVDAANIFSTSPAIPRHHLVVLEDPEHNFLAGNVVPLLNSRKKSDRLKTVLDTVSARLTTADLTGLNAAVSGNDGVDLHEAARDWAADHGFDQPLGN